MPPAAHQFFTSTSCAQTPAAVAPKVGATYSYAPVDASGRPDRTVVRIDTVVGANRSELRYNTEMRMGDTVLERTREASLLGLLPTDGPTRRWTYRDLDPDRIRVLTPGETLTFTGVETADLSNGAHTHEGPIRLTFVGCAIANDRIPAAIGQTLRVYRLERFWQTPGGVKRGEYEIALAPELGWRVYDRDGGTAGVVFHAEGA